MRSKNKSDNVNESTGAVSLNQVITDWEEGSMAFRESMINYLEIIENDRVMGGAK